MILQNTQLLSVIIPVYNTEQYLEKCLQSVANQTYRNLEIILVDDGSTDSSGSICDEYARKDSRVRVIHKENAGVVSARNCGIEAACGERIAFVDSDDWIELNMYEELLEKGAEYDFVSSGEIWNYLENKNSSVLTDLISEGAYKSKAEVALFFNNMIVFNGNVRGIGGKILTRIFKTSILKTIYKSFPVDMKYLEDVYFTYAYCVSCSSFFITHDCYYHYRQNDNSAMHKTYRYYLSDLQTFYWGLHDLFSMHFARESLINQLQKYVNTVLVSSVGFFLGFNECNLFPSNLLPYGLKLNGKKIVLYGAGKIGRQYYWQIKGNDTVNLQLWVDSLYEMYKERGEDVHSVDDIFSVDYDFIVLAVKSEGTANEICKKLIEKGIPAEKILWKRPLPLINFLGML